LQVEVHQQQIATNTASGVDTGGKSSTGMNDTGDKFSIGFNDTCGKSWEHYQTADILK
jgi:hypothetical protein